MIKWSLPLCAVLVAVSGSDWLQDRNRSHMQTEPSCLTPARIQGNCVSIRQCPVLLDLIPAASNDTEVLNFLRRSSCSQILASDVVVCCPMPDSYPKLMSPPVCGKTYVNNQHRVVGRVPAKQGAWPWIALLGYKTNEKIGPFWQCGGALISQRYVLTAAHCISPSQLKLVVVRLGEGEQNNGNDEATTIDIMVESAVSHPNYSFSTKLDDIGLVKLERSVEFSRNIQPICLPKLPDLRSRNFVNYYPFVAGWGEFRRGGNSSNKLIATQIPVTENESCDNVYKPQGVRIGSGHLCTGYENDRKDSCLGDSGGPMMFPKGDFYYIIGIVSYDLGCAVRGFPGIYTRVTSYLDWISLQMSY